MTQGVPTPEATELEFRKHYLVTGNVAGSAKAVGLPPSTGYELRNRALDDPAFIEARRRLRERLEPDAEQMAVAAMQLCMERLNKDPDERLQMMLAAGAEKVNFQDSGAQYAASLAKLFQAILQGRRFEGERDGSIAPQREVTIRVLPTEPVEATEPNDPSDGGETP
jgi:hypothetical protein